MKLKLDRNAAALVQTLLLFALTLANVTDIIRSGGVIIAYRMRGKFLCVDGRGRWFE
jgi:hypothetical protein